MSGERWSRIGKLFDAASSMPAAQRDEWLRNACGDDDTPEAEVEHLLAHDRQAHREEFLDAPEVANPGYQATGSWPPGRGRHRDSGALVSRHPQTAPGDGADGFSPRAVITSAASQPSEEETRAIIQSRLRELPMICVPIFAMMLFTMGWNTYRG